MAVRNGRDGLAPLPQWKKKGHKEMSPKMRGRPKGSKDKLQTELKRAIIEAAAMVGRDAKGKNGLHGYLMRLAITQPKVYGRLLEKLIPMHIKLSDDNVKVEQYETVEELRQAMEARGLPQPVQIIDVTPNSDVAREPLRNGNGAAHD